MRGNNNGNRPLWRGALQEILGSPELVGLAVARWNKHGIDLEELIVAVDDLMELALQISDLAGEFIDWWVGAVTGTISPESTLDAGPVLRSLAAIGGGRRVYRLGVGHPAVRRNMMGSKRPGCLRSRSDRAWPARRGRRDCAGGRSRRPGATSLGRRY
jgi:hypothetical protein